MADAKERERLLEKMKHLTEIINKKRQRDMEHIGRSLSTKNNPSGNVKQLNSGEQQQRQSGCSAATGKESLLSTGLPFVSAPTTRVLYSKCASTANAVGTSLSDETVHVVKQASVQQKPQEKSVQQKLQEAVQHLDKEQSQRSSTLLIRTSSNNINAPSSCAEKLDDQRDIVNHQRIVILSLDDQTFHVGKGSTSSKQGCKKGETLKALESQVTKPAQQTLANFVQCTSLSGITVRKHAVAVKSLVGGTASSKLLKGVTPNSAGVQSSHVSGEKLSSIHVVPVQFPCVSKNMNRPDKGKVVMKNAAAIATQQMLKDIEELKARLSSIVAAKKRQNAAHEHAGLKGEISLISAKTGMNSNQTLPIEKMQPGLKKDVDKQMFVQETADSTQEVVMVSGIPVKDRQDFPEMIQCSDNSLKGSPVPSSGTVLSKSEHIQKKEVTILENSLSKLIGLEPAPVYSLSVCEQTSTSVTKDFGKSPCSSPSRSVVKANLMKELNATEEKLHDMRKKIGFILKESPQKTAGRGKRGSCLQRQQSDLQQRPLPNRSNLKWTPRRISSEKVLVVGCSPNIRDLAISSVKGSLSSQSVHASNKSAPDRSIRGEKQSGRKSQYSFVRNSSSLAANKSGNTASHALVTQSQKHLNIPASSKSFVSRYKIQRTSSRSKANSCAATGVVKKTVVQSRYKLMKVAFKDSPHLPAGVPLISTPMSVRQKAAQTIKSKYKMRRVPLTSMQCGSAGHNTQQPNLIPKRGVTADAFIASPGFSGRCRYSYGYQFSNSFVPARTVWGRGSRRQRMSNPAYFQSWQWKQGNPWYSYTGWGFNNPVFPRPLTRRQRALAAKVWRMQKMQLKMKNQWGHRPYNVLTQRTQMNRAQKKQMMLLKRQQWRNVFSFREQAHSPVSSIQKRRVHGRREKLVMIGGTVYKSSARRLTKAVVSAVPAAASAVSPALWNSSKGGKQQRMKTVVVRGIHFSVDARGTRLQRLTNSAKKGSASGLDVRSMVTGHTRGTLDSHTQYVINRVKQRSIQLAAAKIRKKEGERKEKKHCLYFSRFGKCSRGDACPYLHDPAKVAVCTRFLRGTCQVENCPFSHKVSKEKMPVCAFFLKGVCTRELCPYLHVKVSQGAKLCQDFISGFCPLAEKCQKLHVLTCPHFSKTGTCPEGKKCRLLHRKGRKYRTRYLSDAPHTSADSAKERKRPAESSISSAQETQQNPQDEGCTSVPPPCKRSRLDLGRQQQSEQEETQSSRPLHSSQTLATSESACGGEAVSEERIMAGSSTGRSQQPAGTDEDGWLEDDRSMSPLSSQKQRLGKQPAFISLADYSFDESSVPKVKAAAASLSHKSATVKNKGSRLQIKPQF